jgi:ubiquitin carboxyl-terminal hydrolase 8
MDIKYDINTLDNIPPKWEKYRNTGMIGLVNLGNTCFLNACIQILNHTYELHDIMDESYIVNDNGVEAIIFKEWNDIRKLWLNERGTISPNKFVHTIQTISLHKTGGVFSHGTQNDISEVLLFIIESIHCTICKSVDISIQGRAKNNTDKIAVECYSMLKKIYSKEYSPILELFYGISVNEIVSLAENNTCSIRPEHFFTLNLDIDPTQKSNIYDSFDRFIAPEMLVNENAWWNDKANKKEDAQKRVLFWSFPKILVILLKRFLPDGMTKINQMVDFPHDLDLEKYVYGYNANMAKYDLYGVCNHTGNVNNGHYTAFVKNISNEWLHFNDVSVTPISPAQVITPMAYILFYRKKNTLL